MNNGSLAFLDYFTKRMEPGFNRLFLREVVEEAFPPTGCKDTRPARLGFSRAELQSLSLALSGLRPNLSGQTTLEQFREHLGPKFAVSVYPRDGEYHVHRFADPAERPRPRHPLMMSIYDFNPNETQVPKCS